MSYRTLGVVAALFVVTACSGHSNPIAPTPDPTVPSAATAGAVFVTPHEALPVGGGKTSVDVYTSLSPDGRSAATFVPVHLEVSAGSLSTHDVTTDTTGHAKVEWSGDHTATITAIAQRVRVTNTITVQAPTALPTPTPGHNPSPTPAPSPTPLPTPAPGTPTIAVTVSATPNAATVGQAVTLRAVATTNADAGGVRSLAWDLGDGSPETVGGPTMTVTYTTTGVKTIRVRAVAVTWTTAEATTTVTVSTVPPPSPAVTVSLSAAPTTGGPVGTVVTFTATATPNSTAGTVMAYQWDFDGDGTFDATTTTNTVSHPYPLADVYSPKVKVTTTNGAIGTASTTVVITT